MADGYASTAFAALDTLTDFAAILDGTGTVVYANPHALRLLGHDAGAVVGTSIAEHLHHEDLERALTTMGRINDGAIGVPVTPAFYRLRRTDGSWLRIELNATTVPGPDGTEHLVVFGRYSGDHDLQDHLMDLLTGGADSTEAFALVPDFGNWRHTGSDYAVFFHDDDGEARAAGSPILTSLGGLDDGATPWAAAAVDGCDRLVGLADVGPDLAAALDDRHVTHLRVLPVADPLHGTHAVVAFARTEDGAHPDVHEYALEVMAKVLRLVVLWRDQVVRLRRAATRDPLTGLANRTGFWDALDRLDQHRDVLVGVLYVDLDGFKAVNDHHGHGFGDEVLTLVAERLRHVVRPGDTVARIGGDEFAVIAAGLDEPGTADAIAARIVDALRTPVTVDARTVALGASVGVATVPATDLDPDRLLEQADRALYQAKAAGRGRWHRSAP